MVKKIILFICLSFLSGCVSEITQVTINDVVIDVETADSIQEMTKGLMFRESLEGGMLFVYNDESVRTFWMKNTLIPLDIIFIDAENKIIDIQTMEPCTEDPCERYSSAKAAKYALEVNSGFALENNILIGDEVIW